MLHRRNFKTWSLYLLCLVNFLWFGKVFVSSRLWPQLWSKIQHEPVGQSTAAMLISWSLLRQFDLASGLAPASLKVLNGKRVKLAGFFVPLGDDFRSFSEFLLVPNAQACIHVPAPPANLIVYVKLKKSVSIETLTNPLWVEGSFSIETNNQIQSKEGLYKIEQAEVTAFDWSEYQTSED